MIGGVWSYVAAGALVVAMAGGIFQTGYNAAWRRAQVDPVRAERDIARADLANAKHAADMAAKQAVNLSADAAAHDIRLKELTDAIANANGRNSCVLGDFARQLRGIR